MTDRLPIFEIKDRFLRACREPPRRVLLSAPTGSGKSTQIPQFLFDSGLLGDGRIVILQSRRLAARLLAARVAAALLRYHCDTDALPDTLDALVPDYLPSLPLAFTDGAPLSYTPVSTPLPGFILSFPDTPHAAFFPLPSAP